MRKATPEEKVKLERLRAEIARAKSHKGREYAVARREVIAALRERIKKIQRAGRGEVR